MSERFEITDEIMPLILLYSKVTIALNAARIMKVLGGVGQYLGRKMNRTEEYLIRFAATTLMINAAGIFDSQRSSLNLRKLVENDAVMDDSEKHEKLQMIDTLYKEHKRIIDHIKSNRDNLVAHTNKGIDSVGKFMDIEQGDVADMQAFLNDAANLIESFSVFPSEAVKKERVIDYADIRKDLKE